MSSAHHPEQDSTIVLCVPLSQLPMVPGAARALVLRCESCGAPIWVDLTSIEIIRQTEGSLVCNVHGSTELLKPDTFLAIHPAQGADVRRLLAALGVPTIEKARELAMRMHAQTQARRVRRFN